MTHLPSRNSLFLLGAGQSNAALVTFLCYMLVVFGLAWLSNRLLKNKSFLSEYFLGSRSLGVWAFALTFAATSSSGGSFTGFPSKIYSHGWILGLWIGSYIVVPICAMGLLGKRINQVARRSGAITIPDVLRDRFDSKYFGLLTVSLVVFFMAFNLVAQFKAGSEILSTLMQDVPTFKSLVAYMSGFCEQLNVAPDYFICLVVFAVAVIIYTTYGGFHAVVWTDVMQGVVMVIGVMLMVPLALWQVNGLSKATEKMKTMVPPRMALIDLTLEVPLAEDTSITSPWLVLPPEKGRKVRRLFRVSRSLVIKKNKTQIKNIKTVEIRTPWEIEAQLARMEITEPEEDDTSHYCRLINADVRRFKRQQLKWLDKNENKGSEADLARWYHARVRIEKELQSLSKNREGWLNSDGLSFIDGTKVTLSKKYGYGDDKAGTYVTGPGPSKPPKLPDSPEEAETAAESDIDGFLPFSLAISFFFMWAISGAGQPSSMVRLMAFKNSLTLRRAIFTVAIYYSLIYFPLVIVFCCARVILPGMELESDAIMPQMAVQLTAAIGQGWLAGLLVAAPFAAVMSTVDSFLLMISSAVVRDIYQRRPSNG